MASMPVLFVGHGSPMNAIEDNVFSATWRMIGRALPRPRAILAISAHWYVEGSFAIDEERPRQIYDMYGFPEALYQLKYRPAGAPELARALPALTNGTVSVRNDWGIDHGSWSVLTHLFPDADVPVVQLSVDHAAPAEAHYALGQALAPLREEGVLLFASGNVVHNLRLIDWDSEGGQPWADAFDTHIRDAVLNGRHEDAIRYQGAPGAARAVPTPDHYFPLLYALGAARPGDKAEVFCDARVMGSLSMTSYLFA